MGGLQYLAGKRILLVQLRDRQRKEMGSSSLVCLSSKEEVEMDEPL